MNTPESAPYDPFVLSKEEQSRFMVALGDGYGNSHWEKNKNLYKVALPSNVDPGLLHHNVYYEVSLPEYVAEEDSDDASGHKKESEFWKDCSDRMNPPYQTCPVNFHLSAILEYFLEQKNAYLIYAKSNYSYLRFREDGELQLRIYGEALKVPYSKPWYEYHINSYLHLSEQCRKYPILGESPDSRISIINFLVILGRLVEQYYWKFIVEKAAIRGQKIVRAAATGGDITGAKRKAKQRLWQAKARSIWKEHPSFSKMTVASIIGKRLRAKQSAKHISRYLIRPE